MTLQDFYKGRAFHNWNHIEYMLKLLEEYPQREIMNKKVLQHAIKFHDVVHNPTYDCGQNELQSIAVMFDYTSHDLTMYELALAAQYIFATIDHKPFKFPDSDVKLFLDLDLAILGSKPNKYREYKRQIRAEYKSFSRETYNFGRILFLDKMLKKRPIFNTYYFREKFEEQARQNMIKERYEGLQSNEN